MKPAVPPMAAGLGLALVLAMLVPAALSRMHVPGSPQASRWVLQDFRDAVYYPVVAWRDGRNPYDTVPHAEAYPVDQSFPLYLPHTLLVHLPFGLLSPATANLAYLATAVLLTGVLAALALGGAGLGPTPARVVGLTALLLASRAGQMNLFLGQVTLQVVIGCYVAMRWARSRPVLAGAGLALAMVKPTFGVPLAALVLLGAGAVPTVAAGGAICAALCVVAGVPLVHAAGGAGPFLASLGSSAEAFSVERSSDAWSSFARVDATGLLARGLGRAPAPWLQAVLGLAVVGAAATGLRRLRDDARAPTVQLGVGLVCLTILLATYHQTYDALLLAQPAVALAAGRWGNGVAAPRLLRWGVLALLLLPSFNYLATSTVAGSLPIGGPTWLVVTSAGPLALLAAWAVHLRLALRPPLR